MLSVLPLLDETPIRGLSYTVPQPQRAGIYRNNHHDESKEDVALLEPGTTDGDSGLQGKMMTPAREQCRDLYTRCSAAMKL